MTTISAPSQSKIALIARRVVERWVAYTLVLQQIEMPPAMKAKDISRNFDPVFAEKFLGFKFAPYSEAPDNGGPGALLIWFVGGPCDGGVEYSQGDLEPPEFIDLEDDNTGRYHLRQNKYQWIA